MLKQINSWERKIFFHTEILWCSSHTLNAINNTKKKEKRYYKECYSLHYYWERVVGILDTTIKLYQNCGKDWNSLSPTNKTLVEVLMRWNPIKMNPLRWTWHFKEFKLESQSHSWLIATRKNAGIIMLVPKMISMQIEKLGIVANPICSMDDVQANCKVRYCCKFAIL